jgi:hypothetical protein
MNDAAWDTTYTLRERSGTIETKASGSAPTSGWSTSEPIRNSDSPGTTANTLNGRSEYRDPWLNWRDGNVYSKSPDEPIMDKMVAIAKALNAKVQGDDGEVYLGPGRKNVQPAPPD